jgi:phosphoglycerate dehydrogenase-like enzyme
MKKSAVYMNIGRGTAANEDDLVKALNTEVIAGAMLDVLKKEPLAPEHPFWKCKNLLKTPHCSY